MENLKEYRCYELGNLLCKAAGEGQIEIINHKNRVINYVGPSRENQFFGPKGQDFSMFCNNLNCKGCKRLQARAIGTDLVVEIKCHHCGETTLHDLEELNRSTRDCFSTVQKEMHFDQIRKYLGIVKKDLN